MCRCCNDCRWGNMYIRRYHWGLMIINTHWRICSNGEWIVYLRCLESLVRKCETDRLGYSAHPVNVPFHQMPLTHTSINWLRFSKFKGYIVGETRWEVWCCSRDVSITRIIVEIHSTLSTAIIIDHYDSCSLILWLSFSFLQRMNHMKVLGNMP